MCIEELLVERLPEHERKMSGRLRPGSLGVCFLKGGLEEQTSKCDVICKIFLMWPVSYSLAGICIH